LPAGTKAVYFYVEPNPFEVHTFEAIAQPCGVSTGPFTADGSGGATYVGFYATGSSTIESITITCTTGADFAVGELGWAGGVGPGDCVADLSPGTGSPPATLGGFTMTPVPYPGAPACTGDTPPLPVDGGDIGISPWDGTSRCIGSGWATWSHGYTGDVYYTGGATSQVLTFPAGTKAAYFYVEPDPFALHTFEAIAQPCGVSTGPFDAHGSYGATYVGFYATGSATIESITITCTSGVPFAVGELGWAGDGGPGPGDCVEDDTGKLDIAGSSGGPGGTTAVRARIQGAPNAVGALGFEVVFDPTLMTYTGFERGALVQDFDFFDCTIPAGEDSIVRCGGFKSTGGIAAGASGDVVILDFDVMQCVQGDTYPLDLQELKDDIGSWSSSHGCFQCGCSCDINGDGEITPQDALCAFQVYLGICPTACGPCDEICCDVTLDGDCTPQDALEIFKEYLGLESVCSQPVAPECTPPPYNPEKWNDGGTIQHNNNCYNYANDEITGTFAQPGRACGDWPNPMECGEVYNAAACDGLVPSTKTAACPDDMHKVYLVVWPYTDYHWYRQDIPYGMWSHKPGSTPATDRDGSGQPISDPETADTGYYTSHCGYLCACGDNADIQ
jgi:hypothetical protein